jgi:hypothetical protein
MTIDYDCRAEATNAMELALAATNEQERLSWIRVALAWQNLTHIRQVDVSRSASRAVCIDAGACAVNR